MYISREEALSHPFANGKYDKENANYDFILGFESYKEWLETLPIVEDRPTDIMECARAIKEYCKSKPDNVFLACFKCPFFDGLEKNEETVCKLFGKPPHEWNLPEGEKE